MSRNARISSCSGSRNWWNFSLNMVICLSFVGRLLERHYEPFCSRCKEISVKSSNSVTSCFSCDAIWVKRLLSWGFGAEGLFRRKRGVFSRVFFLLCSGSWAFEGIIKISVPSGKACGESKGAFQTFFGGNSQAPTFTRLWSLSCSFSLTLPNAWPASRRFLHPGKPGRGCFLLA